MQDFNTIIGVIQMRQNDCSFSVIQKRYHIGSGTTQRILSRFEASGLTLEELRSADPRAVEELFYPPEQVRRKDVPLPDFQYYYDRDVKFALSNVITHKGERNEILLNWKKKNGYHMQENLKYRQLIYLLMN